MFLISEVRAVQKCTKRVDSPNPCKMSGIERRRLSHHQIFALFESARLLSRGLIRRDFLCRLLGGHVQKR